MDMDVQQFKIQQTTSYNKHKNDIKMCWFIAIKRTVPFALCKPLK